MCKNMCKEKKEKKIREVKFVIRYKKQVQTPKHEMKTEVNAVMEQKLRPKARLGQF